MKTFGEAMIVYPKSKKYTQCYFRKTGVLKKYYAGKMKRNSHKTT
jgi:hypothetical protein